MRDCVESGRSSSVIIYSSNHATSSCSCTSVQGISLICAWRDARAQWYSYASCTVLYFSPSCHLSQFTTPSHQTSHCCHLPPPNELTARSLCSSSVRQRRRAHPCQPLHSTMEHPRQAITLPVISSCPTARPCF